MKLLYYRMVLLSKAASVMAKMNMFLLRSGGASLKIKNISSKRAGIVFAVRCLTSPSFFRRVGERRGAHPVTFTEAQVGVS